MQLAQPTSKGIARFIPGLALIKGFSPALLRTEFVVAITVFAVLVPSAMAFGDLAGVTPVAGLYVALGALVAAEIIEEAAAEKLWQRLWLPRKSKTRPGASLWDEAD